MSSQSDSAPLVCIVGAGPAGLATAKRCMDEGLDVLVLDESDGCGGLWRYDPREDHPCIPREMFQSNTSRDATAFADFPMDPQKFPDDKLTGAQMVEYLENYVQEFGLAEQIRMGTRVTKVHRPIYSNDHAWQVDVLDLDSELELSFLVDAVAVCSGHHRVPNMPNDDIIKGFSTFTGTHVHSAFFKTPSIYSQKKILIAGMGNSGMDVWLAISSLAEEAVCCSRREVPSTPRGSIAISTTPRGNSAIRPSIVRINKDEVIFADKSKFKPDVIVWCWGYNYDFPFLDPSSIAPVQEKPTSRVSLYQHIFPVAEEHIGFIGLISTNNSIHPLMEAQARLFARVIAKKCELPPQNDMIAWIKEHCGGNAPSYQPLQVDFARYREKMFDLAGVDLPNESEDAEEDTPAKEKSESTKSQPNSSPETSMSSASTSDVIAMRGSDETKSPAVKKRAGKWRNFAKKLIPSESISASGSLVLSTGSKPTLLDSLFAKKGQIKWTREDLINRAQRRRRLLYPLMRPCPVSASACTQGRRPTMEDEHVQLDALGMLNSQSHPSGFWGVYDGHGGCEVSALLKEKLHASILDDLEEKLADEPDMDPTKVKVKRMLCHIFRRVDTEILAALETGKIDVGSTAVVCLLLGRHLWVANCGDSECVLGRQLGDAGQIEAVELSFEHKPHDPKEKKRIELLGGMVLGKRVYGKLGVSRSFGDFEFKPPFGQQFVLTAEPHVKYVKTTPDDLFVIMACDGLWDKITHAEAVQFVHSLLLLGVPLQQCAQWLLEEAIDRISRDNVTVLIVDLRWGVFLSQHAFASLRKKDVKGKSRVTSLNLNISDPIGAKRVDISAVSPRSASQLAAMVEERKKIMQERKKSLPQ